jgi:hypothetical protein
MRVVSIGRTVLCLPVCECLSVYLPPSLPPSLPASPSRFTDIALGETAKALKVFTDALPANPFVSCVGGAPELCPQNGSRVGSFDKWRKSLPLASVNINYTASLKMSDLVSDFRLRTRLSGAIDSYEKENRRKFADWSMCNGAFCVGGWV